MDFDETIRRVGPFGPFQFRLTILVCSTELLVALHSLSPVFIAYSPPHWCATPEVAENSTCSPEQLRHLTSPVQLSDTGDVITYDSCKRYDHDYLSLTSTPGCDVSFNSSSSLVDCEAWEYDRSHMIETTVTDFNLVCSRSSLAAMVAGIFLVAQSLGFFIFGAATDRLGRRFTLLIGNVLVASVCVATYFAPSFKIFLGLRIALAFSISAAGTAGLITVMEFVGTQYRVIVGVTMGLMWGVAPHLLTALSYLIKDWRILHLALAAPTVVTFIAVYFFVPESPRWLIVRGKQNHANTVLVRMADFNGHLWNSNTKVSVQNEKYESVLKMLGSPSFLYISFVQYVSWFASGLVYYGIVFSSPNLGDNPFVSYSISCIIDFPCLFPLLFLFSYIGRVLPLSIGNFTGGALFLLTIVNKEYWTQIILVMLAKGCIASCYTGIWIYTNEVYPTSVRSSSSSFTYIFTRIGSALGAYVWYLADIYVHLPILVCGGIAMLAGILNLSLPESLGADMTQTIQEGERFVKKNMFGICRGKAFEGRRRDRAKKRAMTEKNTDYASEKMVTSI